MDHAVEKVKLPGAEIGRWTLRFRAPEVERAFARQTVNQSLWLIRVWSVVGIAVFCAFGLLEWWIHSSHLVLAWSLRYGLILPILLAFYFSTYTRWRRRGHASNLVFCTSLVNAAHLYLLAVTPFPQSMIYY